MKITFKSILNMIIYIWGITIILYILYGVVNLIMYYHNIEYNLGYKIRYIYTTIGDKFEIGGDNSRYTTICDNTIQNGCFLGYLKGVTIINSNEAYIYFQLSKRNLGEFKYGETTEYKFSFFGEKYLNTYNTSIPEFGYIKGNNIYFYTLDDLNNLNGDIKNTFYNLKKNPSVIINGKNYKHYTVIPKDEDWNN